MVYSNCLPVIRHGNGTYLIYRSFLQLKPSFLDFPISHCYVRHRRASKSSKSTRVAKYPSPTIVPLGSTLRSGNSRSFPWETVYKWRFPNMGLPVTHPVEINHPAIGGTPLYGTPRVNHYWSLLNNHYLSLLIITNHILLTIYY